MNEKKTSNKMNRVYKVLLIGLLLAFFAYLFHPGVGNFNVTINGEPVAEPLVRFAAVPTFFILLFFTLVFMVVAFLGVGFFLFLFLLLFGMAGIVIIAPYFWPILAIVFLTLLLASLGSSKQE